MAGSKLNSSFETFCALWAPEKPHEIVVGTIFAQGGRMHFLTSPRYAVLGARDFQKAFWRLGDSDSSDEIVIPCLQGRTQDEECTVFGLREMNSPSVLDGRSGESLSAARFSVSSSVLGMRLAGAQVKELDNAAYRFTDIHQWFPGSRRIEILADEVVYHLPRTVPLAFHFSSLHLRAEVRCELTISSRNKIGGESSITPVPLVRVIPCQPESVEWFAELIPRFENFFSLFLGTSIAPRQVTFLQGRREGSLVMKQPRRRQKTNRQLWVRCPADVVAKAMATWLAAQENEQAIEKTLLGTLRKSSLFVETEFLSLAQALEAFGRLRFNDPLVDSKQFKSGLVTVKETIRAVFIEATVVERFSQLLNHANETSFSERLRRTWSLIPAEFFEKHFGEVDAFSRSIVQTRNFFTHLGTKPGRAVVRNGHDLFCLNQKLTALLRCVMLIDLGIPFEHLREPIAYQASRWS